MVLRDLEKESKSQAVKAGLDNVILSAIVTTQTEGLPSTSRDLG
jgi:hypothetical protein